VEDNKAYIDVLFIHEESGIREIITFCIDTGANSTCLFEREAIRLGIDLRKLKRVGRIGGVGGMVNAYLLKDAKIGFPIDQHRMAVVSFQTILILILGKNPIRRIVEFLISMLESKSRSENQKGLPNLLGFDFLKHCKISFSDTDAHLDIDADAT
jgi:predicted aspartyl protease